MDAGLVPSFDGEPQETIEVFIRHAPLAPRRKRNAPRLKGVVKPAAHAHDKDLVVPAVAL